MLAALILAVHIAIIGFNLFGLVAIPIGARLGWAFVRAPLWRGLHILSLAIVALQAALGRACFLTIWQDALNGHSSKNPLLMRWVNAIIFWPLPMWGFSLFYILIFIYVLALLWWVPPHRQWRRKRN